MNILDFLTQSENAQLRTAAGHQVVVTKINESVPYPIEGYAVCDNDFKYHLSWDVNGSPVQLPATHGMNLMATVPVTSYKLIQHSELRKARTIDELYG